MKCWDTITEGPWTWNLCTLASTEAAVSVRSAGASSEHCLHSALGAVKNWIFCGTDTQEPPGGTSCQLCILQNYFFLSTQYLQVGLHRQAELRQFSQATVPRKVSRSLKTQQLPSDGRARWHPLQPSLFVKSKSFHLLPHLNATIMT